MVAVIEALAAVDDRTPLRHLLGRTGDEPRRGERKPALEWAPLWWRSATGARTAGRRY